MKYIHEFRDPVAVQRLVAAIHQSVTQPWRIMEICGGQTHSIVRHGLDQLLPPQIDLIHGPGCPVCVTAAETIDAAIALARHPQVILCSFGDMLRVPGSPGRGDLLSAKALGADVRILYSPLDALAIAQAHPDQEVVFFAVGFETTAPATAMTVYQAAQQGLRNFSLLVSHVRVPPAMAAILATPDCQVQGFLAAGHVCTVMGLEEYQAIARRFSVPIVITGFEPVDILQGLYHCLRQLEQGQAEVENQYTRSVRSRGNPTAQALVNSVFAIAPQTWRGIGELAASGLELKPEYAAYDIRRKGYLPQLPPPPPAPASECISGQILQGIRKPQDCPAFGRRCTPDHPLGAPMVSSEGACAAYYRYRQPALEIPPPPVATP